MRGLSSRLLHTQSGKLKNVNVTATVKPHATTSQILDVLDIGKSAINRDDIIVLSVGSNDRNPFNAYTSLCNTLFKLRNHSVFLLTVVQNRYLNSKQCSYNDIQIVI